MEGEELRISLLEAEELAERGDLDLGCNSIDILAMSQNLSLINSIIIEEVTQLCTPIIHVVIMRCKTCLNLVFLSLRLFFSPT